MRTTRILTFERFVFIEYTYISAEVDRLGLIAKSSRFDITPMVGELSKVEELDVFGYLYQLQRRKARLHKSQANPYHFKAWEKSYGFKVVNKFTGCLSQLVRLVGFTIHSPNKGVLVSRS